MNLDNISNSDLEHVIDEWTHNERDRAILKRRFIDGIFFEQLSEEFNLSVRQTKRIVYKYGDIILNKINK